MKSIKEIWDQADRIVNNPNFKGDDEKIGAIANRYEQNIYNQNISIPRNIRFRRQYPVSVYRDGEAPKVGFKPTLYGVTG